MSTNVDFDRMARAWLAEGPTELADRVLADALREIRRGQRRRPGAIHWRALEMTFHPTSTVARAAMAIAIGAIAIGGAAYLLAPRPGIGGPSPVPTPSATHRSFPTVSPHVTVSGTITTASGGPVFGTIYAFGADIEPFVGPDAGSVTTNPPGRWELPLPAGGTYCFMATARDTIDDPLPYGATELTLFFGPSRSTLFASERECVQTTDVPVKIDLVLPAGVPVSGTLAYSDGTPLGSAGDLRVDLQGMIDGVEQVTASTIVDAQGRFSMHLLPGTWSLFEATIQGTRGSWGGPFTSVAVGTEPITGLTLKLSSPPPTFTTLEGRVVDAAGTPRKATISVYHYGADLRDYPEGSTTTNAGGHWTLTVSSGADYCLAADLAGGAWSPPSPVPSGTRWLFFGPSGATVDKADWECFATTSKSKVTINLVTPR